MRRRDMGLLLALLKASRHRPRTHVLRPPMMPLDVGDEASRHEQAERQLVRGEPGPAYWLDQDRITKIDAHRERHAAREVNAAARLLEREPFGSLPEQRTP